MHERRKGALIYSVASALSLPTRVYVPQILLSCRAFRPEEKRPAAILVRMPTSRLTSVGLLKRSLRSAFGLSAANDLFHL